MKNLYYGQIEEIKKIKEMNTERKHTKWKKSLIVKTRKQSKHFKKEYGYFGYLAERKLDRAAYINDCVLGHPRKSARHMAKHPA